MNTNTYKHWNKRLTSLNGPTDFFQIERVRGIYGSDRSFSGFDVPSPSDFLSHCLPDPTLTPFPLPSDLIFRRWRFPFSYQTIVSSPFDFQSFRLVAEKVGKKLQFSPTFVHSVQFSSSLLFHSIVHIVNCELRFATTVIVLRELPLMIRLFV